MTEQTGSISSGATSSLSADAPTAVPTLIAKGSFVAHGLNVVPLPSGLHYIQKYVGEQNVPADVKRQRRYTLELLRRMGTPVIIKKMLTAADVDARTAVPSPNYHSVYGQTRNRDPFSHGTGFVSVEESANEYISPKGDIFHSEAPQPYLKAPKYRGFGPGFLTYMIEPDVAEDFYKHTPEGVFLRVQQAQALTCWYPDINDNDLVIHCTLDEHGNVLGTQERYQAKMVNPVSIRGLDRRGRREYSGDFGNRFVINQTFEMTLVPPNNSLYDVETDR